MARIITLISPTAGVGKTNIGVNLAYRIAGKGHSTCLFNTDSNTTIVNSLLRIHPQRSMGDLVENRCSVDQIIHRSPFGIDFFPATPGVEDVSGLKPEEKKRFVRSVLALNPYDYFILDTFPGLSRNVVAFSKASSAVVLILIPESSTLTDAYLLLKVLSVNGFSGSVLILINKCGHVETARSIFKKFKKAVGTYLSLDIQPLGFIFSDPLVEQSGVAHEPFAHRYPETAASKCMENISRRLVEKRIVDVCVSDFWSCFLKEMKRPFQLIVDRSKVNHEAELRKNTVKCPKAEDSISKPSLPQSDEPGGDSVQWVNTRLNQLMEQVGTLSQDMEEMKRLVQNRNASVSDSVDYDTNNGDSLIRIPLDFEAYLKKRKAGS